MIIGDSGMAVEWYVVFIYVFVLMFSLSILLAGLFTAYFGAGKSRKIGVGLMVMGIVVAMIFVLPMIRNMLGLWTVNVWPDLVMDALVYIAATLVGVLVALGLFLVAIMKS